MIARTAYLAAFAAIVAAPVAANPLRAERMAVFAANCFSPHLTADVARAVVGPTGARLDFYDMQPFSAPAPSSTDGRAPTPGTDRRCEVAFDGDHGAAAAEVAAAGLDAEGIRTEAPLPASHTDTPGTTLNGARFLNPRRIAVVQTGTRPGPNGIETFLLVERLTPKASAEASR